MLGRGFRLGRLYGINIRVDWSWLLIAFLITWNLTFVFGQVHSNWSYGLRWGLAVVAALLFFASVLAHELAHALVARAQNLLVRNITLFLFGGVANIQREPDSAKKEFFLAGAGPLMNLMLGLVMLLIAAGGVFVSGGSLQPGRFIGTLSPASTLLLWLGSINIILAVFNLIPGYPLDGGRVMRSIFWAISHNIEKATHWAAAIGQAVAWIMIITGVAMGLGMRIPLLGTGFINGVWLAFVGWFLNSASMQSYKQAELQGILEGVTVRLIMKTDPPSVNSDNTISDLFYTSNTNADEHAFPVLENGRLIGMITLADAQRTPRDRWGHVSVRDVMAPISRLVTIAPEDDVSAALEKLLQRDVQQLPVIQETSPGSVELLGLLRRKDIMRWLQIHSGKPGKRRIAT